MKNMCHTPAGSFLTSSSAKSGGESKIFDPEYTYRLDAKAR